MPKSKTRKSVAVKQSSKQRRHMTRSKPIPTLVVNGQEHALKKHRIYSLRSKPEIVRMNSREEFSVLFGLTTSSILNDLNEAAIEILRRSSKVDSASIALEELAREGVLPSEGAKSWLEKHYLGTWDNPEDSVQAFLADYDLFSESTARENSVYHSRLVHVANVFHHRMSNGRTAVWLEANIDDFSRLLMCQFIYKGSMPDVFMPN